MSTRTSKTKAIVLLATILGTVAGFWLVPRIQAAREEARNRPYVTLFGHGSANHMTYHLHAGGKPSLELAQEIRSTLHNFVQRLRARKEADMLPVGFRIHTCLYLHAPTYFNNSLAPLADMAVG